MSRPTRTLAILAGALLLPLSAYAAVVNINTADSATLDTLPGIGPTKAAAIVAYREAHGPFKTIDDIQNVSGIGPVTFSKLQALITIGAPVQPQAATSSSQPVQTVVHPDGYSAASPALESPNASSHAQKHTTAPREVGTATLRGAADAAVEPAPASPVTRDEPMPPAPAPHTSTLFSSTWAVGLLAVVALAGGAFMIL